MEKNAQYYVQIVNTSRLDLEDFHFVYNAVLSQRSNVFDSPYSSFARKLRKCQTKEQVNECIEDLKNKLDKQYPSYNDFRNKFTKLKYSKQDTPDNMKVKYLELGILQKQKESVATIYRVVGL